MKIILLALGALLAFSLNGVAAPAADAALKADATEATILELEKQWYEIRIARDVAAIDNFLADDFTMTTSYGRVVTKAQVLDRYRSPEHSFKVKSFETDDVKVRIYAEVAIVTGRTSIDREASDGRVIGPTRFSRVYSRVDGRWHLTAQQMTRIIRSFP